MLVLMEKDCEVIRELANTVSEYDELSFRKVLAQEVKDNLLIQLFINSLARSALSSFSYNNLSGHLYIVNDQNNALNKKQLVTLEIKIDKNCCLQVPVRTFTSKELERFIEFKKDKSFTTYPQYELVNNRYLKRIPTPTKSSYILRQTKNRKSEVKFLDFYSLEKFYKSKCGIIQNTMEQFSRRYKKYIDLRFSETPELTVIEHKSSATKIEKNKILKLFTETPVRIVDFVKSEGSAMLADKIEDSFSQGRYQVKQSKYLKKGCFNICVIHEKETYEEREDPHDRIEKVGANQCVTIESFFESSRSNSADDFINNIKNTIIHELLIKKDLKEKRVSLYRWDVDNHDNPWTFIEKYQVGEDTRFCCMTIQPDGSFDFVDYDYNLFTVNEYTKYANAFEEDKNTVGLIEDSNGNINCIIDTNQFTIPDLNGIKTELTVGNNKLRNKEMRESLLAPVIDINYFLNDEGANYYVGTAQDMLKYTSRNSVPIRLVKPTLDSSLFFDKLLPLMNVMFVKNGQLTVIPFPFKYIREHLLNLMY